MKNKPATNIIGGRIWLITGEGNPRTYRLRAMFRIGEIELSDNPKFKKLITETDGQIFNSMRLLNKESWFSEFRKEQGNFAFGFNPIRNLATQNGLHDILIENTLR